MAQLRDTTVTGSLNVTGTCSCTNLETAISSQYENARVPVGPILRIDLGTVGSLPKTIFNSSTYYIDDTYDIIGVQLTDPYVLTGNLSVTLGVSTSGQAGYGVTLNGTLVDSTRVILYLAKVVMLST